MSTRTTGRRRLMPAIVAVCGAVAIVSAGCAATEPAEGAAPTSALPSAPAPATAEGPAGTGAVPVVLRPQRITIPAIGVDTGLVDLGLEPNGALAVPPGGFPAGWYTGSPVPGDLGPAVVTGHVDWNGEPGVFYRLHELAPGDEISATRSDGVTTTFRVTRVDRYAKNGFPTEQVYGDIDHPGLRLITCGGEFDSSVGSYRDNVVVYAAAVGAPEPPGPDVN